MTLFKNQSEKDVAAKLAAPPPPPPPPEEDESPPGDLGGLAGYPNRGK